MQKVINVIPRKDGSEVRITATPCFGLGLAVSVDVYVHHRESTAHEWKLANNRPHPNWRSMSRSDYIKHGRSEMLRLVSHGEILKATSAALANQAQSA